MTSQRRGTLTAETVRQQIPYVNTLQAVCSLKEPYSWSVRTSSVKQGSKSVYTWVHEFWSNNPVLLTPEGTLCHRELRFCSHVTKQVLLIYFTWQSEQFWVLEVCYLSFHKPSRFNVFLFFFSYLGGHGSVICQTKCFLRLAMCTHQVSVACKSHFTKCQKNIPLQSEWRGENICHRGYTAEHFLHLAELQRDSCNSLYRKLHDSTNQKQAGE